MLIRICCLLLGLMVVSGSYAVGELPGQEHAISDPAHSDDGYDLRALAAEPYRPAWSPLPMFRGDMTASLLRELLASPNAASRARSAFLLGQIADPDSVKLLAERLKDADRSVRVQSGIALAWMGDERGIPVCAAAIKADEPWIRYYAVCSLWHINTPRAKSILKKHSDDSDELVRLTVKRALETAYITQPTVTPAPSDTELSPKPSEDQIWEAAAGVFEIEADWWWHDGDYNQAVRCLEAEIFLKPDNVEGYSLIAWLQWSMDNDAEAVRTLQRGIATNPSSPDAHYSLGFHYFNTKRHESAEEYLQKTVELGGDHLTRRTYAHCLEQLGKLDKSLEQWNILLGMRPDDPVVLANRDRVQKMVEETKE